MQACQGVEQYFIDPSSHLKHHCADFFCVPDNPEESSPECKVYCREYYDCLMREFNKRLTSTTPNVTMSPLDRGLIVVIGVVALAIIVVASVFCYLKLHRPNRASASLTCTEPTYATEETAQCLAADVPVTVPSGGTSLSMQSIRNTVSVMSQTDTERLPLRETAFTSSIPADPEDTDRLVGQATAPKSPPTPPSGAEARRSLLENKTDSEEYGLGVLRREYDISSHSVSEAPPRYGSTPTCHSGSSSRLDHGTRSTETVPQQEESNPASEMAFS